MLESIAGAVIAVDGEGRIQFFNSSAEKLTGWASDSACQRFVHKVVQLRDHKGQSQIIDLDSAMTSHQTIPIGKSVCYHKDGKESVVTGSIGPMRQKDSGLLCGAVLNLQTAYEPFTTLPSYPAVWSADQATT